MDEIDGMAGNEDRGGIQVEKKEISHFSFTLEMGKLKEKKSVQQLNVLWIVVAEFSEITTLTVV